MTNKNLYRIDRFETMDDDDVARAVQVGRLPDGSYRIELITLWRPEDEPMVTALQLSVPALNLLTQALIHLQNYATRVQFSRALEGE